MRLFFISLAIAVIALLPEAAELRGWDIPDVVRTIARIPAAGLGYMTVFFHEIGHTVTLWSYGQGAVPVFNFSDGGGFAQPFMDRSLILQGIIYTAWVVVIGWLFRDGEIRVAALLLALLALHACFTTGDHYMLPVNYFGNGGAMLVGCFCIWRAALNKTVVEENAAVERYMHMIFGLYAVCNEGLGLGIELLTNFAARAQYDAGIGDRHIANDFTVLADRLGTNIQHIAGFHLAFTLASITVMLVLIYFGLQQQAEDAATEEAPVLRRLRK